MKHILLLIALLIAVTIIFLLIISRINTRPLSKQEAAVLIEKALVSTVKKSTTASSVLVQIDSGQRSLNEAFAVGASFGRATSPSMSQV